MLLLFTWSTALRDQLNAINIVIILRGISYLGIWFSLMLLPFFNNAFYSSGFYRLPPQLDNQLFKFDPMKGNKRIPFSVLSMQNVTGKLPSKYHFSLYTKIMIVINKEDWKSMK